MNHSENIKFDGDEDDDMLMAAKKKKEKKKVVTEIPMFRMKH